MTDTITERPIALGDRVTYSTGGSHDHTGTVAGIFKPAYNDGSLWVVTDGGYLGDYPLTQARDNFAGDDRVEWWDGADPEARGHWVSRDYDHPRHAAPSVEALQVAALEATVSDLRSQVAEARTVIGSIGEALKEQAHRSEWCGEYERLAQRLIDSLPSRYGFADTFAESALREREWEVCVHWTETVEHSTTVTVTASSESEAVDMVSDNPTSFVDPSDRYSVNDRSTEWDEIHAGD